MKFSLLITERSMQRVVVPLPVVCQIIQENKDEDNVFVLVFQTDRLDLAVCG
jgi:hypothetical protein